MWVSRFVMLGYILEKTNELANRLSLLCGDEHGVPSFSALLNSMTQILALSLHNPYSYRFASGVYRGNTNRSSLLLRPMTLTQLLGSPR